MPQTSRQRMTASTPGPGGGLAGLSAAHDLVLALRKTPLTLQQKHYLEALLDLLVQAQQEAQALMPAAGGGDSDRLRTSFGDLPLIDPTLMQELHQVLGANGVRSMVKQFLATAGDLVTTAETAATNGDLDGLGHASHSLVGAAGAVGLSHLARISRDIMTALRSDDPAKALHLLESLRPVYAHSVTALTDHLRTAE